MKRYTKNNKTYTTICSIHEEIRNIFKYLSNINSDISEDSYNKISRIAKDGLEYLEIACQMGKNMEKALSKYYDDTSYYHIMYSDPNQYNLFEEIDER